MTDKKELKIKVDRNTLLKMERAKIIKGWTKTGMVNRALTKFLDDPDIGDEEVETHGTATSAARRDEVIIEDPAHDGHSYVVMAAPRPGAKIIAYVPREPWADAEVAKAAAAFLKSIGFYYAEVTSAVEMHFDPTAKVIGVPAKAPPTPEAAPIKTKPLKNAPNANTGKLAPTQQAVLDTLAQNGPLTETSILARTNRPKKAVQAALDRLGHAELITALADVKVVKWAVTEEGAKLASDSSKPSPKRKTSKGTRSKIKREKKPCKNKCGFEHDWPAARAKHEANCKGKTSASPPQAPKASAEPSEAKDGENGHEKGESGPSGVAWSDLRPLERECLAKFIKAGKPMTKHEVQLSLVRPQKPVSDAVERLLKLELLKTVAHLNGNGGVAFTVTPMALELVKVAA